MTRPQIGLLALLILFSHLPLDARANEGQGEAPSKQAQRMTPELLWKLGRLGEAAVSPDGSQAVYTVRHYELAQNKGLSALHMVDLSNGQERVLIKDWPSLNSIQWSSTANGPRLFFIGRDGKVRDDKDTDSSGPVLHLNSSQAWMMDPTSAGQGNTAPNGIPAGLTQVTNVEGGIANLKVSPTAQHLAFTVEVKMDKTVNELFEDLPDADARIIDSLMYRHWDAWHDYAYTHLHVAPFDGTGLISSMTDLMKGLRANCPVPPFGGSEQFNWSPDGKEIAYTLKNVPNWAESTNSDVYVVPVDGSAPARNVTQGMPGYDNNPVYSPDGKFLAFDSMKRASFESDRNRIMVMNRRTGEMVDATRGLDQTAHGATWMPDSKSLVFASETQGTEQLFRVSLDSPGAKPLSKGRYNWGLKEILPGGGKALVSRMDMLRPKELFVLDLKDASAKPLTHINDAIYATLDLPVIEERWVEATDGKKIHCWVIHPPDFEPKSDKKWPMLTYCQGGPQGQIGQWFSYRWNFHLMAANGYVIVAPNRRGLPGFGRAWNDQISGDWGGQAMKDILSATDSMTAEPYIDKEHVAAIGASFGGYTVYWLMGNSDSRFCSMVAHCGVFNLESMYGATEELFFVNYDLGGPYWKSAEIQKDYDRFSPNRFVGKWKTPLLVIHGERDFRVPVTQGMEAFTAAQVQHVESRFLYYPNEGHWVLSPQNGVLWHRVFFEWVDRFCQPAETPQPDNSRK
ncbi:MAG: S9 family peptidase [Mariniblastus sp.]|nr:S9 family peptidase [Mariniblastus sp.]